MSSVIHTYLQDIARHLQAGNSTEHTHRPALQTLLQSLLPDYHITNEPRRIACGAPDFEIAKHSEPIGHIEAKDIGVDLNKVQKSEQLQRYLPALHNLLLTDYLEFRWFVNGEYQPDFTVKLASVAKNGQLIINTEAVNRFENLIKTFVETQIITLNSPEDLAKKMAHIAQQMKHSIALAYLNEDENGKIHQQLKSFREVLIDTLSVEEFADMVAQTICYGLFTAKCSADFTVRPEPVEGLTLRMAQGERTLFSRLTAVHFVPKTNPFLRQFFNQLAGIELDERLVWMVEHLVAVLNRADIGAILADFGKRTRREDPVVHFYETFLANYDAKLREVRGVYYTPEPVVSYIVRSVDLILKKQFGLREGLADSSILTPSPSPKGRWVGGEGEIHKVQILDPATGTGTFLYAVIAQIYQQIAKKNKGGWSDYVSKHLLPRVHGFELLMAAYTVAHIKLSLQLKDYGYDFKSNERLRVFLTNTLDEAHGKQTTLLSEWLSNEANAASSVKRDSPVMVILGNPPYSGHSANTGAWISDLLRSAGTAANYFEVDGQSLNERNPKWLNDDYVKFIRFAHWRIMQTGYGVLAFVTNHGYLDNPTFRGMRQSLLQDFDEIYILDLHGNSKKKETAPDGSVDKNVFDIQQGVAIGIFVKHKPPSPLTPLPEREGNKEHSKVPDWLLKNARMLRKSLTDAEQLLWSILRARRFLDLKFRRQHPIAPYILDFYCHELKLAIEIDGGQHNTDAGRAADEKRSLFLIQQGITVLRFWNNEVLQQTDAVLEKIYLQVTDSPTPTLPQKGREQESTTPSDTGVNIPVGTGVKLPKLPSPLGRGVGGEGDGVKIYHAHLYGDRKGKYQYLAEQDINTTGWTTLKPQAPFYLFVPQNVDLLPEYEAGWKITEMMPINSTGVKTHRDHFVFDFDKHALHNRISDFRNLELSDSDIAERYDLKDTRDWKLSLCRKNLSRQLDWQTHFTQCLYRPFDLRFYYHHKDVVELPRDEIMQHFINQNNLCLGLGRQGMAVNDDIWHLITCAINVVDTNVFRRGGVNVFPLYLYLTQQSSLFDHDPDHDTRKPNFSPAFITDLESRLQLTFIPENKGDFITTVSALDVFHTLYAVFHSPSYRTRYAEFLKMDFPRLPLISDKTLFKQLADLGEQLVSLHLGSPKLVLDSNAERSPKQVLDVSEHCFPIAGDNLVEKIDYQDNKIYINKTQYFDHVTPELWAFHIGGYKVCQKWLKDRKGRQLSYDDCNHYLTILAALEHTQTLMLAIDDILVFPIL